jgi:hypothetical protein
VKKLLPAIVAMGAMLAPSIANSIPLEDRFERLQWTYVDQHVPYIGGKLDEYRVLGFPSLPQLDPRFFTVTVQSFSATGIIDTIVDAPSRPVNVGSVENTFEIFDANDSPETYSSQIGHENRFVSVTDEDGFSPSYSIIDVYRIQVGEEQTSVGGVPKFAHFVSDLTDPTAVRASAKLIFTGDVEVKISPTYAAVAEAFQAEFVASKFQEVSDFFASQGKMVATLEAFTFTKSAKEKLLQGISVVIDGVVDQTAGQHKGGAAAAKSLIEAAINRADPVGLLGAVHGFLAGVFQGGASQMEAYANDPPDPNFGESVSLERVAFDPVSLADLDPEVLALLNAGLDLIAYQSGTLVAFERYQGAFLAGDFDAATARLLEYETFKTGFADASDLFAAAFAQAQPKLDLLTLPPGVDRDAFLAWLNSDQYLVDYTEADLADIEHILAQYGVDRTELLARLNAKQTFTADMFTQPDGDALRTGLTDLSSGLRGAAAVPEPGTWLAMLVGFAAIGASLRRRKRRPFLALC